MIDEKTQHFIKKMSLKIYIITKNIEESNSEKYEENRKYYCSELKKIDKEILKHFGIKMSDKLKESTLDMIDLMKK